MTNHPPSMIVSKYLTDQGIFSATLTDDWALFFSSLPDGPRNAGAFFDTQGIKDGRISETGENVIHEGLQLRVRSKEVIGGWAKIKSAEVQLSKAKNVEIVIDSDTYILHNVSLVAPATQIGPVKGASRYMEWTSNFILTVTQEE